MRQCYGCGKTQGPLKRYMWNINHNFDFQEVGETQRKNKPVLKSESGLLCDACAKKKGAWQTQGQQELVDAIYAPPTSTELSTLEKVDEMFDEINSIIEHRQS